MAKADWGCVAAVLGGQLYSVGRPGDDDAPASKGSASAGGTATMSGVHAPRMQLAGGASRIQSAGGASCTVTEVQAARPAQATPQLLDRHDG